MLSSVCYFDDAQNACFKTKENQKWIIKMTKLINVFHERKICMKYLCVFYLNLRSLFECFYVKLSMFLVIISWVKLKLGNIWLKTRLPAQSN